MKTDALQKIGLTKSEMDVYLTLLKLGTSTITPIKKKIGVHPSKIYEYLNNLEKKALISRVKKQNSTYFTASNPSVLVNIARSKISDLQKTASEVEKISEDLMKIESENTQEMPVSVYEGFEGFKHVYEKIVLESLQKSDIYYVLGAKGIANIKLESFFEEFHRKRVKKGIRVKLIFNYDALKFAKKRSRLPLTEVKYLPKDFPIPSYLFIAKDYTVILYITERSALSFMIKNQEIADGHLQFFRMIWKIAKKL